MRCSLVLFALFGWAASLQAQPPQQAGVESALDLASTERRVRAVVEKVAPAVVRIANAEGPETPLGSGVIVTADGHVLTIAATAITCYGGISPGPGGALAIYLASGRRVTGTTLGWSGEWGIGLARINEKGPWPHVKLDQAGHVKAGQLCVALGHLQSLSETEASKPSPPDVHLGLVTKWAEPIWLSSSCVGLDPGSGLFDLQGRLLGVTTVLPGGLDPVHTSVELVTEHWDQLAAGKNLDRLRLFPCEEDAEAAVDGQRKPVEDAKRVAAATAKAKAATVLIRFKGEEKGGSGVIISSDGYVATCAHHYRLPGEDASVGLPDGRETSAKVLGTNPVSDVCLVKIAGKGPWPHVELGNSAVVRPSDPCLVMGYPAHRQDKGPLVRKTEIVEPEDRLSSLHLFTSPSCPMWGGDSGGGVFDPEGRLLGVHKGGIGDAPNMHARVELFRKQWDFLAAGKPVDVISSQSSDQVKVAFGHLAAGLPPIVVEVLGDNQRRALGTIVRSDGRILTKASELYGALSCRFADGRVLPATVNKVLREHDLAVLEVQATDLPVVNWSETEGASVGALVATLVPNKPPMVGGVCLAARPVPPVYGWLGVDVKDTDRGLAVHDDRMARDFDVPLRKGDVIVRVDGHRTPDLKTFRDAVEPQGGDHIGFAGDPVRVEVNRRGKTLEFRFPTAPTAFTIPYLRPKHASRRSTGLPSAFEAEIAVPPNLCGGPVIDVAGRVVGVAIARRTTLQHEGAIHVIPATVARSVLAE